MPRTAEHEIRPQEQGPVVARETELGDLTVSVVTFREEMDLGPILAGLPGGSCACPHWGVLRAGRAEVRYDDGRAETVEPGELYVMSPGHACTGLRRRHRGADVQPDGGADRNRPGDPGVHGRAVRRREAAATP